MLITCSSCNSKYLINSADLKPEGRMVRCAKCGLNWHQTSDVLKQKKDLSSSSNLRSANKHIDEKINNNEREIHNLPSTYVMDPRPSIFNTLLLLVFIVAAIIIFWILKAEKSNVIALANFYINEFYFNLKLIINDFAKIIHKILN